ncbi:MAG: hypothetical protein FWC91_11405, partial [Defluviitaleaceae bacterium]|nr:hypothetical protein [Defluviitaleaceae bacterium]
MVKNYKKPLSLILVMVVSIVALGLVSPQVVYANDAPIGSREATRRIPVFNNRNLTPGQNDRNIVGHLEIGERVLVHREHGARAVSISNDRFPTNLRQEPTRYIDPAHLQAHMVSERVLEEGTRTRYVAPNAGTVTTTIRSNPLPTAESTGTLRTGNSLYVSRIVTMSDGSQWAHIQVQDTIHSL